MAIKTKRIKIQFTAGTGHFYIWNKPRRPIEHREMPQNGQQWRQTQGQQAQSSSTKELPEPTYAPQP